jgi:hypothetical protein
VGRVASIRDTGNAYTVLVGKCKETHHLGDPGIDERMILKWILRKSV